MLGYLLTKHIISHSHFPPVSLPPSQMNFLLKVGLIQLLGFSYSHGLGVILSSAHSTYLGDLGKL